MENINNMLIIDATNSALGRLASFAAKQALLGKSIIILNCENVLISGNRKSIIEKYKQAKARGSHNLKGPNFPREPFRILKRTIRGMLRYKRGRGSLALKKVICYNNTPQEYENTNKIALQKQFKVNVITLKELSQIL